MTTTSVRKASHYSSERALDFVMLSKRLNSRGWGSIPMLARDLICEAISNKRLLKFSYGNHMRVVEPHLFGRDAAGHELLSAYLVRGYSESRQRPYWRSYLLSNLTLLALLDERFPGPRQGYNPKAPRMQQIYCRL